MRTRFLVALAATAVAAAALAAPKKKPPSKKPDPLFDAMPLVPLPVAMPPEAAKESPRLSITSSIGGAQVTVDGRLIGETPMPPIVGLAAGKHLVIVTRPGYSEYHAEVDLTAGETKELTVVLVAAGGSLTVRSAVLASAVFIDGQPAGPTPLIGRDVTAGEHSVEVRAAGFETYIERVDVKPGEVLAIDADVKPSAARRLAAEGATAAERRVTANIPLPGPAEGTTVRADGAVPVWQRWWVWAAAGAVVLAAVTTTAVVVAPVPSAVINPDPTWDACIPAERCR